MTIRLKPGDDLARALEVAPAGEVIELLPGAYHLVEPLVAHRAVTLKGAGMDHTRLECALGKNVLRYDGEGRLAAFGITFARVGGPPANAVLVEHGEVMFTGCRFTGARFRAEQDEAGPAEPAAIYIGPDSGNGLVLRDQASGGIIRDCEFSDNECNGLEVFVTGRLTVENCHARRNQWSGIALWVLGDQSALMGNRCEENYMGILVSNEANPTIERNTLTHNGTGIQFEEDAGGLARANLCEENYQQGLLLAGRSRPRLETNAVRGNQGAGIACMEHATGKLVENDCEENTLHGIYVRDEARPFLKANHCARNGQAGIRYEGQSAGTARSNACEDNQRAGIWIASSAHPRLADNIAEVIREESPDTEPDFDPDLKNPETVMKLLGVAAMTLEVGLGLVPLVDPALNGVLMDLVCPMRVQIALETGFILPGIQFKDNLDLRPNTYQVLIKGNVVASGDVLIGYQLAIPHTSVDTTDELEGFPTFERGHGVPAVWVTGPEIQRATELGYVVMECTSVLIAHVEEVVRTHAFEILSHQEVQLMLEKAREKSPTVVGDLVPHILSVERVHAVLRELLRERVSIRDLTTILERLAEFSVHTRHPEELANLVRASLARQIGDSLADAQKQVLVLTLAPALERALQSSARSTPLGPTFALSAHWEAALWAAIAEAYGQAADQGVRPSLLCDPSIRMHLFRFLEHRFPRVAVITAGEIHPIYRVVTFGQIAWPTPLARWRRWLNGLWPTAMPWPVQPGFAPTPKTPGARPAPTLPPTRTESTAGRLGAPLPTAASNVHVLKVPGAPRPDTPLHANPPDEAATDELAAHQQELHQLLVRYGELEPPVRLAIGRLRATLAQAAMGPTTRLAGLASLPPEERDAVAALLERCDDNGHLVLQAAMAIERYDHAAELFMATWRVLYQDSDEQPAPVPARLRAALYHLATMRALFDDDAQIGPWLPTYDPESYRDAMTRLNVPTSPTGQSMT